MILHFGLLSFLMYSLCTLHFVCVIRRVPWKILFVFAFGDPIQFKLFSQQQFFLISNFVHYTTYLPPRSLAYYNLSSRVATREIKDYLITRSRTGLLKKSNHTQKKTNNPFTKEKKKKKEKVTRGDALEQCFIICIHIHENECIQETNNSYQQQQQQQ